MKNLRQGFTLVELLIVIAIIGILAVGLIVALDPVEQTKKATDSNLLQSARQIKDATDRYYSSNQMLPGCSASPCTTLVPTPQTLTALSGVVPTLVAAGELKSTVPSSTTDKLFISTAGGTSYTICYAPQAKTNLANIANMSADNGGYAVPTPPCVANSCYQCLK